MVIMIKRSAFGPAHWSFGIFRFILCVIHSFFLLLKVLLLFHFLILSIPWFLRRWSNGPMILLVFSLHDIPDSILIFPFLSFIFDLRINPKFLKILILPFLFLFLFPLDNIGIKRLPILSNGKLLIIIHRDFNQLFTNDFLLQIMEIFHVTMA